MMYLEDIPLQAMIEDARKSFPNECCGFVFGREQGTERWITEVLMVDNAKEGDRRRRFVVTPKDYLRAEAYAESKGLQLLGVYHSHPDHPAIPSEHDRVAAQPYFSYLILSVQSGRFDHIRSWQLNEELQFEEEVIDPAVKTT